MKGIIKIPISEVWELVDKPHRFFSTLREEVEKLPVGEYDLLDFDEETKKEIVDMIEKIRQTGKIY